MAAPLSPERWARVERIFAGALERAPEARAGYLAAQCGGDEALRAEVESLLAAEARAGGGRFDVIARVAADLVIVGDAAGVGRRLGAYRLEAEVGRGGMGVVYRGVREGADFEQTVAVKVLPGALFRPEAMERFRNERRILAGLEHPNIARLLDGGATPEGVPYVIMEYVDGVPLDRYVDARRPPLEARIRLFLAICDAVGYAHRHLVVHRDLKPSNILVTADGTPKLLDFGIAKLLDPDAAPAEGAQPPTVTRMMTPRYASPEQLRGERIGTPSDVYSLGLVLYRLLSGIDARGGVTGEGRPAGEAEIVRQALESDPPAPSAAAGDARLRGDLDTIVLTAVRRGVAERYGSVGALADDLTRYLEGRPIAARRPTPAYRLRKFVRRNRAAVLGGALAAALLVAQTGVFLRRLAQERDLARREADRATQTLDFLVEVFRGADPFVAAASDLTATELLAQGMARMEEELAAQPAVRAEILDAVGDIYQNLGAMDSARTAFERSLALRTAVYGAEAPETARGISQLAGLLIELDEVARADSLLARSLAIRRATLPPDHPDIAVDLGQRAQLAGRTGRLPRADTLYRAALAIMERPSEPREELRASLLNSYGMLLEQLGHLDEAEARLNEALEIRRAQGGERSPNVAATLSHLALVRQAAGELGEAEAIYRELLSWTPGMLGETHASVTTWRNNLAAVLKDLGRQEEALEMQQRVLADWQGVYGDEHGQVATAYNNLGNLYAELGRHAEAETALREALRINRALYGAEHPAVANNLHNLAVMAWRRGDMGDAARLQREVLALDRRLLGPEHEFVANDLTSLGNYYLFQGDLARAEEPLREGYEMMRRVHGAEHPGTAHSGAAYADLLVAQERGAEAEPIARAALETRLRLTPDDRYSVAGARCTLGAALTLLGRYAEAERELTLARDALRDAAPESDPMRLRNLERLETLRRLAASAAPIPSPSPTPAARR